MSDNARPGPSAKTARVKPFRVHVGRLAIAFLALVVFGGPARAAPAFMGSVGADDGGGGGGIAATPALNATGANEILICTTHAFAGNDAIAPTDSTGANTYTKVGTTGTAGSFVRLDLWKAEGPTVSSSMTFGYAASYASMAVMAFSGMATGNTDQQAAGTASSSPVNSGSIIPAQANEALISCAGVDVVGGGSTSSVDSSFTKVWSSTGADTIYLAAGYRIDTTIASASPNWTYANSGASAARVASFTSSGGSPPSVPACRGRLSLLGVGC